MFGAWLFVSPWVLRYSSEAATAAWNAHIVGAAILVCALCAIVFQALKIELLIAALGAWLVASAWLPGVDASTSAFANALIAGITIVSVSTWAFMEEKNYNKWRDEHHMAY